MTRRLHAFVLAGVFTAPTFLDEFRTGVVRLLETEGWDAQADAVFPYGDWGRSRLRQAAEIALDCCRPTLGGRRALACFAERRTDGREPIALIGHSGGAVAAVHAAERLRADGANVAAVVMIGSPKTPIPSGLREATLFLYAGTDPVARLGFWRGKPPGRALALATVGGHTDYFRSKPPFVNADGRSNLAVTLAATAGWLKERLSDRGGVRIGGS